MNSKPASNAEIQSAPSGALTQIPWARPTFHGNEQKYLAEAINSSWISSGKFVDRFEDEFAKYIGQPYAVTSSNGTTALHMALLSLSISPGDEIIVPGFAFMAAANVALHMRVKPVFTDVDPATWCMTAHDIERCITPRTKAVVAVHTYGNVCEMDPIVDLLRPRSVAIIEDAAEAFGSRYKHQIAGTIGDVGTFSFHATKTITTGEGGMVTTGSQEVRDKLCLYRNHGMLRTRYWHEVPGHNFRLTNLQAAIGCAQLERLDEIVRERQRICDSYRRYLSTVSGVTLQCYHPNVKPVVWAIAVTIDPRAYPQGRDAVMHRLRETGIETRNGFYAASMMHHLYSCSHLPVSEALSRQVISLPTYCTLQDSEIEFICSELHRLRC